MPAGRMEEKVSKRLKDKLEKYGLIPVYILFILIGIESLAHLNPLEGIVVMIFNPFALVINLLIISLCFLFLLGLFNNKYIGSSILLIVSIILGVAQRLNMILEGLFIAIRFFNCWRRGTNSQCFINRVSNLKQILLLPF